MKNPKNAAPGVVIDMAKAKYAKQLEDSIEAEVEANAQGGEDLPPVKKLSKDLINAVTTMGDKEVRYLVDCYYILQDGRKRAASQAMAMGDEPHEVLKWLFMQSAVLEGQVKRALDRYTKNHEMGAWMRQIYGIGPVISAGLLAHLDITKAETVGHFWAFAGYDPTKTWEKNCKRPWNASLRVICWKAGQSFMKFSNRPECFYGHLYRERKEYEIKRNESGGNAERAKESLSKKNFRKDTEAYKSLIEGRLPPAHIDAQARRYAVKLFLAHLHGAWYKKRFGKEPPLPYPIAHLGHAHIIKSPVGDE